MIDARREGRPLRVLFVTHNVPRYAGDAAGSFILRLAVGLRDAQVDVEIIAPGGTGLARDDSVEGVPITRVRYANDAGMTLAYEGTMVEAVRRSWAGRIALVRLLLAMRRETRHKIDLARQAGAPIDVVHAHWWFPSGLAVHGLSAQQTFDVPLLAITMHGSDVRLAQALRPAQRLMRAVLGRANLRTAVSSWLADLASRVAPDKRIFVAPMPVDTRYFGLRVSGSDATGGDIGTRRPTAFGSDKSVDVLFVGRLNAQKGLSDLLAAFAAPELVGATLRVVGDGPDRDALNAAAIALGVHDRVRWSGHVRQDELPAIYRSARVLAVPSHEEGLGLVAVEAQLCGTPVVAYASGGLPDVVRPDAGGTLVNAGDVPELARGLAQLLDDETRAKDLGSRAQREMRARFTPAAVAAQYIALYREALSDRSSSPAPPTRSRWLLAFKVVAILAVIGSIAWVLSQQWVELSQVARDTPIAWRWVALATAITLATHALLVQSWRVLLAGWDRAPAFWRSAGIWSAANLARFVPGTLWSVGALSMMARQERVSAAAAAGAAIIGTLLNLGAGLAIVVIGAATVAGQRAVSFRLVALGLTGAFVLAVVALPYLVPPIVDWVARKRGSPPVTRRLSARALWTSTLVNLAAWFGYGAAFAAFARGVTPQVSGAITDFVTVYAAAYLAGYVALFLPGGIGVRETAITGMLVTIGAGTSVEATYLAVAHRIWITAVEVVPGVVAVAIRSRSRRDRESEAKRDDSVLNAR